MMKSFLTGCPIWNVFRVIRWEHSAFRRKKGVFRAAVCRSSLQVADLRKLSRYARNARYRRGFSV